MDPGEVSSRLNALLTAAGHEPLDGQTAKKLTEYISLFIRWNKCLNLSAIRDEEGILSRHVIESIIVTSHLPDGVSTLLDFGSGGGLPGIPIALCRPGIAVTLAESQGKKAAFLQEAVRVLGLSAKVHAGRAETLQQLFDCVVLRAVDKMQKAVGQAAGLVAQGGWLALMTTQRDLPQLEAAAGEEFSFSTTCLLPGSTDRVLALAQRMR